MSGGDTASLKQGLCPYSDGSGHRYEISVKRQSDSEVQVYIESAGSVAIIDANDWDAVRNAVNKAVEFICDNTQ